MSGKGKEPADSGQVETPVMLMVQLDPGTLQLLQTLKLVLKQEQAEELKDRDAIKALRVVFVGRMKEEYFLHDSERVTKYSFFEWIERPQKNLSVSELLSEFDRQFL
ncbi:hypothetical protein R1sor_025807 [Riccia sorocarpa]|uniref:Uncharacterized protein n=1 Tax=Riccia sorocarpa TaxID=122646 RepID=A0ABD3GF94_9MARC